MQARLLATTIVAIAAASSALDAQAAVARADEGGLCPILELVLPIDCGGGQPGGSSRDAAAQPDDVRRTSTEIQYDPQRLAVTFRAGTPRATVNGVLARAQVSLEQAIPAIDSYMVGVEPGRRDAALNSLQSAEEVTSAGQDVLTHALDAPPNDSAWPEQWGLRLTGIPQAWKLAATGRVVVAVLDTGVDATHPDLQGVIVPGYDFVNGTASPNDDQGHGTGVAGVIAARRDNNIGIAGVCGSCQIMPVKVLDRNGVGDDSVIAAGIVWAADHGAKVINLSLGGPGSTPALADAVTYATSKGVVLIGAAGNSSSTVPFFPAADPQVLSVAATTQTDRPYVWSNYGDWVKLAAPGCNLATMVGGGYGSFCGTSSATPVVAGLVALAVATSPSATVADIAQAIERPAVPIAGFVQFGRIDASATLALIAPGRQLERAATGVRLEGLVTRRSPVTSFVRTIAGGRVTVTLTQKSRRPLTLSLVPVHPAGQIARVTGSGRLRLTRTYPAGSLRIVVRGHGPATRFVISIVEVAAGP